MDSGPLDLESVSGRGADDDVTMLFYSLVDGIVNMFCLKTS